jgi:hypothetical protein
MIKLHKHDLKQLKCEKQDQKIWWKRPFNVMSKIRYKHNLERIKRLNKQETWSWAKINNFIA